MSPDKFGRRIDISQLNCPHELTAAIQAMNGSSPDGIQALITRHCSGCNSPVTYDPKSETFFVPEESSCGSAKPTTRQSPPKYRESPYNEPPDDEIFFRK